MMVSRQFLLGATLLSLLVAALGAWVFLGQRADRCVTVPLLAPQLLPNADLAAPGPIPGLPEGWGRAAGGVQLRGPGVDGEGFDLDGDGRALQLIGIANYVETPEVPVRPGARYCLTARALTDTPLSSSGTRARVSFLWRDNAGNSLGAAAGPWQPVALWTAENPPRDWALLGATATAPAGAVRLRVRIVPASDDRIYLDLFSLQTGGASLPSAEPPIDQPAGNGLQVMPWPNGRRAAAAFTFDWETAMGGLVHSRSVGDPNFDRDPIERGLRMREGITTTIALFAPYGVRATYYATGYNFLRGNVERRRFMGDPTFAWANTSNGWVTDRWQTTPWFADDPYGTIASDPAWYFGDLTAPLLAAGHEIQSHTFSHLYGGLADPAAWRADLEAWDAVAAEAGVAPARSIAFPWSGSAGMSDESWGLLAAHGISSVTRLSDQGQYALFPADGDGLIAEPRCMPLPGHPAILACPDFYLTVERADLALTQLERALAAGGMIDFWAHTEEVVTPAQIAAWERVVRAAAESPQVWVAPLSEIAAWQQGVAQVLVQGMEGGQGAGGADAIRPDGASPRTFTVTNQGRMSLVGLTLAIPAGTTAVAVSGDQLSPEAWAPRMQLTIDLAPGAELEVTVWP